MKIKYFLMFLWTSLILANNQTPTTSPVLINSQLPKKEQLPFEIFIEKEDFELPVGIQTGAVAIWQGKWLFIAGRINGLHGFDLTNNFPPNKQNYDVFVVDIKNKTFKSRSLKISKSGLNNDEIDTLAVTAPQYYQKEQTLYMTGGYGVDNNGNFSTKPILTAINVPGLISWVTEPIKNQTAKQFIRQITNPIFQVTGGVMRQVDNNPTLLMFGQNFQGEYTPSSNGDYTMQVRRFNILDDGINLNVQTLTSSTINPSFRRRDLNIVTNLKTINNQNIMSFTALAGVFTIDGGCWTVPVEISADGKPFMANPNLQSTFKQGMNIYKSATCGLYSDVTNEMYNIIFGGITFEYFQNGSFQTDAEFPFNNQIVVIKKDKNNNYTQYLLDATYPIIPSNFSNPGNTLLFGAGSYFMPTIDSLFPNNIFSFDFFGNKKIIIGYIIGGIQSTVPNTSSQADSAASPYIFKVSLISKENFVPKVPILLRTSSDCSAKVTVVGSNANSNATINVFANSINIGSGQADAAGNFNFTVPTILNDGKYFITVKQTFSGIESKQSNAIAIEINKAQIVKLIKASSDCSGNLSIAGLGADSKALINVFANSINIGQGIASASGHFNFKIATTIANGTYSISVTQTNSLGCTSNPSNAIKVTIKKCVSSDLFIQSLIDKYNC
ncbi:MAG: hypothetical protein P4L22_04830 [Candidatus Babeliales bacterium]|nr:hypothetical protein [Candidatus Babeliales bacterium]